MRISGHRLVSGILARALQISLNISGKRFSRSSEEAPIDTSLCCPRRQKQRAPGVRIPAVRGGSQGGKE
jgi:hypothetical protein